MNDLKRFRPVFLFLLRFVGVYVAGNLLYGWYIGSYAPYVDPATRSVGTQVAAVLRWLGNETWAFGSLVDPVAYLMDGQRRVLDVYEGCNGINVMIVFVAFLVGWGKMPKRYWWFPLAGLALLHIANLARVAGLFGVALNFPKAFYFVHKYFFTGILFVILFILWLIWIRLLRRWDALKPVADGSSENHNSN